MRGGAPITIIPQITTAPGKHGQRQPQHQTGLRRGQDDRDSAWCPWGGRDEIFLLGEPGDDVEEEVLDCPGRRGTGSRRSPRCPPPRCAPWRASSAPPLRSSASAWASTSTVATRATASGPVFSAGSGLALPVWRRRTCPSPPTTGRWSWRAAGSPMPFGGLLTASTDRVSGKSVMTPARSLVIGC